MKKNKTMNLGMVIVFMMLLLNYQVSSQESDEKQASFINTALVQLFTRITENIGKADSEIKLRLEQENEAQEKVKEVRKELTRAERELAFRKLQENVSKVRFERLFHRQGGIKSINENRIEQANSRFKSAINRRVAVQTKIVSLRDDEKKYKESALSHLTLRKEIEQAVAIAEPKRSEQKANLERLVREWRSNPTEENFTTLAEEITNAAAEEDADAKVHWKSTPRQGVIVYYQTKRARERKKTPTTSQNPTDTTDPESLPIGWYYIWAEEGGRAISDENRLVSIDLNTTELTIIVDR